MVSTVSGAAVASQASVVALRSEVRSCELDLSGFLALLRQAVHETGWGPQALAASDAMNRDQSYISRVLAGEKPLNTAFLLALPVDVRGTFFGALARHHGLLVARPVSPELAVQSFFAGLVGMLGVQR